MHRECLELVLNALHEYMNKVDDGVAITPLHETYNYLFDLLYG